MTDDPLFEIETRLNAIETTTDAETVLELVSRLDWLKSRTAELKDLLENQLIAWITANGDLEIGTVRYYVGPRKKEKCVDLNATVVALFDATGGEFEEFCSVLSANAIKVGAARKVLGDAKFAELFETVIEKELKTGAPLRVVHKVDARFLPPNANVAKGQAS